MASQHNQHVVEWVMLARLLRDLAYQSPPRARQKRLEMYHLYDTALTLDTVAAIRYHHENQQTYLFGKIGTYDATTTSTTETTRR